MTFISKISRALGFGSDSSVDDNLIADDPDVPISQRQGCSTDMSQPQYGSGADYDVADMQQRIFRHVVDTFNNALPSFLQQSVNPDKQRAILYQTLDKDIKQYLDSIASEARKQCAEQWTRERHKLQEKVNELEGHARDIEAKRTEMSQKQLSSERQRRALSDRVHDLEKQVAQLEAEREQFQLESRSLQNKLKVANVQEKENDGLHEENIRLLKELAELKATPVQATADPLKDAEIERLRKESEALQKELETMRASVAEAVDPETLRDLEEKITRFEDIRRKKDNRIAELQQSEKQLKERVVELEQQLQQALAQVVSDSQPADKPSPKIETTQIDDILSDTDWLVSPSSLKGNKSSRSSHRQNKNNHDQNDQMSLF